MVKVYQLVSILHPNLVCTLSTASCDLPVTAACGFILHVLLHPVTGICHSLNLQEACLLLDAFIFSACDCTQV